MVFSVEKRTQIQKYLRICFHILAAGHFIGSCFYDWNYVVVPEKIHKMGKSFGKSNKLKYLTFWDALLQAVFFTIALLNDLIGTNENFPEKPVLIRKIKDTMFASLAFPLASFVGITFWVLYLIDRELVLPRALDPYFPYWLNHCMHTNIMLFIALELTTTFRRYPARNLSISILSVLMLTYLVWIHVIHAFTSVWVYPVLDVLNLPLRLVFFISLLSMALLLYWVGEKLNGVYWKGVVPTPKKSALVKRVDKKKRRRSRVRFLDWKRKSSVSDAGTSKAD